MGIATVMNDMNLEHMWLHVTINLLETKFDEREMVQSVGRLGRAI